MILFAFIKTKKKSQKLLKNKSRNTLKLNFFFNLINFTSKIFLKFKTENIEKKIKFSLKLIQIDRNKTDLLGFYVKIIQGFFSVKCKLSEIGFVSIFNMLIMYVRYIKEQYKIYIFINFLKLEVFL